jgi:hypothetical protein
VVHLQSYIAPSQFGFIPGSTTIKLSCFIFVWCLKQQDLFSYRPCLEAAISLLDRFKRLSDEHLEGVDVSKEWRQLARLRGAAITLGMMDAVKVAEEEARTEKESWAKVVASLEDNLGVEVMVYIYVNLF